MIDEGLLHRMQVLALGETFDGRDLATVDRGGEHHAGIHPPSRWTVQAPHSPKLQPFFVPVKLETFAQQVKQGDTGIGGDAVLSAVDAEAQFELIVEFQIAFLSGNGRGVLRKRRRDGGPPSAP